MKKLAAGLAIATISMVPTATAFAQDVTNPADPNDVQQVDNPVDQNDNSSGFDDWGLLGLAGLLGLLGLAGRKRTHQEYRPTESTTSRGY